MHSLGSSYAVRYRGYIAAGVRGDMEQEGAAVAANHSGRWEEQARSRVGLSSIGS